MRAVICDDHALFADSLADVLSTSGIEIAAVTYTPEDALRALGSSAVDVCSLDVMFGNTSVLDRLAEFRWAAPRARLILLSGILDAAAVSAGRAAGVSGFADKRQSAAEIVTTFLKVAAGQTVVPACLRGIPGPRRSASEPNEAARRLASYLTPRERQVLSALVGGSDTTGLARQLGVTTTTARCHIQSILIKMNVHSRLEAATTAVRIGLLDPESGEWYF